MSEPETNSQARGLLSAVTCVFRCSELPALHWHVLRFTLTEALSEPYRLVLELFTEEAEVDIPTLLGSACLLRIERDAAVRAVHGIVSRVSEIGVVSERVGLRVELVPAFGLRGQTADSRFFQEKSVPEIVTEVLTGPLSAVGRALRLDLDASAYEKREYCVQYRESDLDFVSRLLQEEGIAYRFEHPPDGDGEVLVLIDDTPACPDLEQDDGGAQVLYAGDSYGTARRQSLESLTPTHALRSTAIVQRDFDWKRPSESPYEHERRTRDPEGGEREVYDHDDRRLFSDDGARRARRKLEQRAAQTRVFHGAGDVIEFIPGRTFALLGHPQHALDREHLLVRVTHRGEMPEEDMYAQASADRGSRYVNEFECVPDDVPVRPLARHARPRVHGPTTATVVGPESEEVHTDEHGRVKVLFPWDRLSPADDTASWWVRVAQGWAGPGWGSLFVPRIGMEVVVEFLDGDPDRPLVTGCVYNGRNPPPYALPADKTKSTIKTNTSPSDGGFNELRFEDQRGVEEVFIHAERDLNAVVKRDKTLTVGGDERDTVAQSRTAVVQVNDALTVGMNRAETVGMNHAVTIGMNHALTVGMNQTEQVVMAAARTVGATYQVSVGAAMTEQVGHSKTETIGDFKAVTTGRGSNEDVGEDKTVEVAEDSHETVGRDKNVDAGENLTQSAGKSLSLSAGERMTLSAGDNLTLVGEKKGLLVIEDQLVIRVGEAAIVMKKNGDILISGAKISVLGTGDVKVRGAKTTAN